MLLSAFAAGVVLSLLPLPPIFATSGLDASWSQALHVAVERRLAYGTQVVFTYGPLGFVHARMYWPVLFWITMAFWLLLAIAILDAWHDIARGGGEIAMGAAAVLYGGLALSAVYTFDAIVFVYLLLWVWAVEHGRPRASHVAAHGVMLGLIALSKLTFGLAALLAAGVAGFVLGWRGRRGAAWLPVAAASVTFLAGWLAFGQSPEALPAYFRNAMQVVQGYGEAMSLRGPVWEMRVFGFATLFVTAAVASFALARRDVGMIAACLFTVAIFALAWKQAFTRHDEHAFLAFTFGCTAAGCIATRLAREAPRRSALAALVATGLLAIAMGSITLRGNYPALAVVGDVVQRPLAAIGALGRAAEWRTRHYESVAAIRAANPLPRLDGTVDVYSHDQAIAFAHGLRWQPRPVFQSYSAYTSALAEANRAHLAGDSAPDHVLMRVQAIDGRYPALEDGASWMAMLERYQLREENTFLVLDRVPGPRPAVRRPVPPWEGRGWLELPEAPIVLAALDVQLPRRSLAALFKGPPMVDIEVRLAGESSTRKFRFLPSAARTPFVLSPLVETNEDMAELFLPCPGALGKRVEAVRVLDAAGRELEYRAGLERVVDVPRFSGAPGAAAREVTCRLRRAADSPQPMPVMIGDAKGRGLNVHPPARLSTRAPVRHVEICTRLARPPAGTAGSSDGYILQLVRGNEVVASRSVDRAGTDAEACVAARFAPAADEVELRVLPGSDPQWDWVYISRLALE